MSKNQSVTGPEVDALYRIGSSFNSHLELDEILNEIMRLIQNVTRGDSCLLYLIDESGMWYQWP